jgi:hypothetical protein
MDIPRKYRKVTWVKMGGDGPREGAQAVFATCDRCGQIEVQPRMGIPLDALTAYCVYLLAVHQFCKPLPKPEQLAMEA